ncbi:MAG: dienelactone hydrolase family protein, partial [Blastocatellia bacterium]|nr:dienelactone hydrolase family protein [Blastocatellia bacterium]
NVDHGFFNDTRPVYNQTVAQDAWQRVLALYQQYLQ